MDSRQHRHGHADVEEDEREIVMCHACSHEWFRDEGGLICPDCHSDMIEIIDPENDPRQPSSTSTSPEPSLRRPTYVDDDSDPDEDDIEEHMAGNHGFAYNRSTRSAADRQHHEPSATLNQFFNMINSFGPTGDVGGGRESRFPPSNFHHADQTQHAPGQPRVHRATFRSGPFGGGTASFTIYSGPISGYASRTPPGMADGRADPFQDFFTEVMRDYQPANEQQQGGPGAPPHFLRSLQQLIGVLNPAHAITGDAVYSQEALDRIISGLMEANPQSNAAPPASETALNKLERKAVDKGMLEGESKVECPICIDDMKEGDTAVYLPCKHFFHEDCVVLWLKEHNTCPICRTPIEKQPQTPGANRPGGQDDSGASSSAPDMRNNPYLAGFGGIRGDRSGASGDGGTAPRGPQQSAPHTDTPLSHPEGHGSNPFYTGTDGNSDPQARNMFSTSPHRPYPLSRPPSQSQSRLNEVLRTVSARQRDRDDASPSGYDTSRFQRRNSLSPTSPRVSSTAEQGSRMRQRSPSQSSGRWAASDREGNQQRSSGSTGPFSWLRNRFSSGDSGNGSARDERRR